MMLARSLPDDATEWWIYVAVLGLYVLGRWYFAWRQARLDGDRHPVRAAVAEEDDPRVANAAWAGGFRSYRQLLGFVGSAIVVVAVAALTSGTLRVALLWTVVPLLVLGMSYLDFRQARNSRSRVA